VDLDFATATPPVGRRIAEIPWPPRSTVLAIRRGGEAFEPDDTDRLERGDRLTILVPAAVADDLVDAITADGGEHA
jgi:Trk K+ transport system NAD-binding subunit